MPPPDLNVIPCPVCDRVVGAYRVTLLSEHPPRGPAYPRLHDCPGQEVQVLPALTEGDT